MTLRASLDDGDDVTWIPPNPIGRSFEAVPKHIESAADEAYRCHSINAYRGAIQLARSVIEATAKHHKIVKATLESKIGELYNQGLVRELVRDQAHEIRHLGNDMAHGDFVDPVDEEESAEILALMAELLDEGYTAPAKLAELKAARIAKMTGTTPPAPGSPPPGP